MANLYFFNPGHETAILHGAEHYTPDITVQRMMKELSFLPVWYAEKDDYVYVGEKVPASWNMEQMEGMALPVSEQNLVERKAIMQTLHVKPWGLSPHSCGYFKRLQRKGLPLILPEWKEEYRSLTGRQTAARCLECLRNRLPDFSIPEVPYFCTTIGEAIRYMENHVQTVFVLKSPFSSSGRGILWIRRKKVGKKEEQWMLGVLKKQGTFSIEPALAKVRDFAMEFFSNGQGNIRYEGLSVFSTAGQGAYTGNLLGNQVYLSRQLCDSSVIDELSVLRTELLEVLQETFAPTYEGFLGVDMMLYQLLGEDKIMIHPCVEINMRCTMGVVALRLSDRLLAEGSIGSFAITFNPTPGEAFRQHCEMQKQYPLKKDGNKIVSGYMSLCPIDDSNGYRAYVLVKTGKKPLHL